MHHRVLIRSACRAHNAYNPSVALRAAFGTTTRRCDSSTQESTGVKDEPLPSQWESTAWEPLQTNPLPESPRRPEPELLEEEELDLAVDGQAPTDVKFIPETLERRPDSVRIRRTYFWGVDQGGTDANLKRHTVEPDQWQDRIKLLSDRLNEINDRRRNWTRNISDHARKRLREGVFDYKPHIVSTRTVDLRLPIPWRLPEGHDFTADNVTAEMKRFASWAEPTVNERAARRAVTEETMETVYNALGEEGKDHVCMEIQGSEKTGLALPWSDIDIRIWDGSDPPPPWHLSAPRLLQKLRVVGEAMRNSDKWTEIEVRDSFYPILVAHHKDSGIDIQIVASLDTHAQEAFVSKYVKEMPYLRVLFPMVRTFFSMRNFNNVFTGGLGSYGIFILLVSVLLRQSPELSRCRRPLEGLEYEAMRNFFTAIAPSIAPNERYWEIDITTLGLSCFPRARFKKHNLPYPTLHQYMEKANERGDRIRAGQWRIGQKNEWLPELLCLQDPANPNNDLGRKTYAIKHILASMRHANSAFKKRSHAALKKGFKIMPNESVLTPYIGRPHEVYHDQRVKLEAYGVACKNNKKALQNRWRRERRKANNDRERAETGKFEEIDLRDGDSSDANESLIRKGYWE